MKRYISLYEKYVRDVKNSWEDTSYPIFKNPSTSEIAEILKASDREYRGLRIIIPFRNKFKDVYACSVDIIHDTLADAVKVRRYKYYRVYVDFNDRVIGGSELRNISDENGYEVIKNHPYIKNHFQGFTIKRQGASDETI